MPAHWRLPGAGARRERGSASVEMVILLPALFALLFLGMQAALLYETRTVCIAAAQEGAREAAAENATAADGIDAATSFLTSTKAGVSAPVVTATRTITQATVTVTGTSLSVIPGWGPVITQSATMPVERITQ